MAREQTAAAATSYSDADIEKWGEEAEAGFEGWRFGKSVAGRPISVGAEARPFTLRLDSERRAKLDAVAEQRHITPSQVMRDLIDTL